MTDDRTAYSDSLDFSEQLSYRKHLHPSYRLFYMIFESFNNILELFILTEKEYDVSIAWG